MDIYVGIIGDTIETEIIEEPELYDIYYDGVTTWEDIKLEGGVAVEKGTDNVVDGTFTLVPGTGLSSNIITPGTKSVKIAFNPTDTEKYSSSSMSLISIDVKKGIPAWKDGITPVVTVPYGTTVVAETFHNLRYDGTLAVDETLNINLCDAEGNILFDGVRLDCGTYTYYKLRAASKSTQSNWQPALLPITIIVEPSEAEIAVSYNSITNKLTVSGTSRYLYGTFDIYIDGELVFDDAPIERRRSH